MIQDFNLNQDTMQFSGRQDRYSIVRGSTNSNGQINNLVYYDRNDDGRFLYYENIGIIKSYAALNINSDSVEFTD
ncbi:hypothetical protein Xen7305DRAFT_00007790 [Xenococcus sp. PCC 7305]|nr:hypothetical protein Xen7305DRAFT_00007790 [Xenococcus sp. PCC 7305]